MMLDRSKRIARLMIIFFGLLTVVAGVITYRLEMQSRPAESHYRSLEPIKAYIQEHGLTPAVNDQLAALHKPKIWVATFVVERRGQTMDPDTDRIVAASPPELVGKTQRDFTDQYGLPSGPRASGWGEHIDHAADGRSYVLWTWYANEFLWNAVWMLVAWVSLMIAWLASVAWLILDARGRSATAVAGWVLLALLTGPIALAVWFISRPTQPQPEVCPGCGTDTLSDATYCVHCGHGLKPACPGCRKVVESEWTYCPTCRTNLTEG